MPATMSQAHREVLAILADALPGDLQVAWPDMARAPGFPPASGNWARVSLSDVIAEKRALVSAQGSIRYRSESLLTVEFYTLAGDGRRQALTLGETVLSAFRGNSTPNGVSFRRERVVDVGPDGVWYHVNTLVEAVYDTIE